MRIMTKPLIRCSKCRSVNVAMKLATERFICLDCGHEEEPVARVQDDPDTSISWRSMGNVYEF